MCAIKKIFFKWSLFFEIVYCKSNIFIRRYILITRCKLLLRSFVLFKKIIILFYFFFKDICSFILKLKTGFPKGVDERKLFQKRC